MRICSKTLKTLLSYKKPASNTAFTTKLKGCLRSGVDYSQIICNDTVEDNLHPKPPPSPGQTPETRLERNKNPPLGTITVYKNPPLRTKPGIKSPTLGT